MKTNHKILIIGAVCLVIGFLVGMEYKSYQIGSIFEEGAKEINAALAGEAKTPDTSELFEKTMVYKEAGETVEFATIDFKVNSVEKMNVLHPQFGQPKVANNNSEFLVVDVDITNITKGPFTHYDDGIVLVDGQGRNFNPYSSIGAVENYLDGRELSPNITENGKIIYQIPTDSDNYHIVIPKGGTDELYYISLN